MAEPTVKIVSVDRSKLVAGTHPVQLTVNYEVEHDGQKYAHKISWVRDNEINMRFGEVADANALIERAVRSADIIKAMHSVADELDGQKDKDLNPKNKG